MKKLLLFLAVLFPSVLFAQGSQFQSILLGSTGRPLAGAQITVCAYGSTGIPCQSPINLFSDPALSVPMTNPTKSDSLGNWGFWALPNNYVYTVTGAGVVSSGPFIISVPCNLNSSCSGTTSTFAGLPVSPVTNALAIVTDGNGNNCLGGGGTVRELCQWTGTAWVLISAPVSANFPITAANGGTGTATPIAHGTAVAQGAGTPFNFVLPTSNDQCYMADHTSFATIDPSFRTCPSGGGGGSPSAGAQGVIQGAGSVAGTFQVSNLTELNGVLTNGDDNIIRGPNPGGVDVRKLGARAINPSAIPATNCTITGGTNSASCTSTTGLQVGDGYAITTAGASQSMTTPAAPTVTPSCAAGPTGLGFTVPAGAGSTAYQYQLSMRDVGQGLTAAGTAGTTATGNASLGANNTAWTSSASGTTNVFTATVGSTANLAAGCMVVLKGSTDDAGFGGWKIVTSVVDGTHFTYTSGVDASRGISTTTVTGGTVSYWLCNHVVLPTPGAGGTQYAIYGRTAGSMAFLQMSLLANLGYTDPTYNTFDDYGSPMMDSGPRPWFVPTTPPVSATNDTFTSTIATIVGSTLTFAGNAPNTASAKASQFDNAPNIAACITATNSTSTTGAGGSCRVPVVVENSGTGNYCFVTSTYLVVPTTLIQDGAVCFGDTMQLTGNWYGTDNSAARLVQPPNGTRAHVPIQIQGANPGIWIKSAGGLNKVSVSMTGNGGVGVFNAQMNAAQVFEDDNFYTGITNDYMSIAFYDYQSSVSGGFGGKMRNTSWAGGPDNVTVGRTATPIFATKFSLEWDFDYVSCYARGYSFVPYASGLLGNFHMGEECQGNIMPIVMVTPATVGTTSGSFKISQAVNDTGPAPTIANLGPLNAFTNADITIEGGNLPSANQPLISGSPFLGSVFLSGLSPGAQIGQNINLTVIGRNGNFASQLRTPSIRLAAINYIANHTLAANEGIVNAQATLTFTVDTTLGDGQGWDVYSETGTTTLTVSAGVLHGNAATGNITIPNNSGMHVFLKGGNAYAYGLGGGGAGGSPGGTTNALQSNGGGSSFQGTNPPTGPGIFGVVYDEPTSATTSPAIRLPGIPVNPQSGTTYTIGAANYWTDRGTMITATNAGAQTYTAVNPSTTGFGFNMPYIIWNRGAGVVTENSSGFNLNGGTSLAIPSNWVAPHYSNGVDYFIYRVPTYEAFPASCTTALTVVAGVFSCGGAGTVSGVSGDGSLITNSGSTGAVTLTLGTATANKVWANCTGSTATPTYCSITDAMLTAVSHAALTNQANTYTGGGLQDFSAMPMKIHTSAGFTAGATDMLGYDSTNKNPHCYDNNADAICLGILSAPTTGDLADYSVVAGNVLAHDSGILTVNVSQKIASGTAVMGTSAITSGACATVVTVSGTGIATTDVITVSFNSDPTAVTGYGASATGAVLTIYPYPTANNANFKVCNSTASSITPSALTLNWKVVR